MKPIVSLPGLVFVLAALVCSLPAQAQENPEPPPSGDQPSAGPTDSVTAAPSAGGGLTYQQFGDRAARAIEAARSLHAEVKRGSKKPADVVGELEEKKETIFSSLDNMESLCGKQISCERAKEVEGWKSEINQIIKEVNSIGGSANCPLTCPSGESCVMRPIVENGATVQRPLCVSAAATTPNMHDKAAFLLGAQFEGGALVNISGNGIVTRGAGAILGQLGFSTGGSFDLVGNLGVGINTVTKGFVPATLRAGLEVGISPWKEKRVKLLALFNYEGTAAQGAAMTSTDPTCVDQFGRPKADPFMRCTTGDHAMKWLQQYAVGVGVKGDFLPGAGSARIQPKFLASVGWGDEGGVSIMLNAAAAFDWNKTSK